MRQASSTMTTTTMTASPHASDRPTGGGDKEESSGRLRLAIVGANADELGIRIGERYGLAVRSMDELMEGRRGRRTDNVKAKAVLGWLEDEGVTGKYRRILYRPPHTSSTLLIL